MTGNSSRIWRTPSASPIGRSTWPTASVPPGAPSLVPFNFWITPDEANLDPERGGLTVWDVAAPADWNSQRYIGDTAGCQTYLKRMGAKSVTIPYRANRAIVFA